MGTPFEFSKAEFLAVRDSAITACVLAPPTVIPRLYSGS